MLCNLLARTAASVLLFLAVIFAVPTGNRNETPLEIAIRNDDALGVKKIVAELGLVGSAIDEVVVARQMTPLTLAVFLKRSKVIPALFELGANVNCSDNAGWAPLLVAASRGYPDIVALLLDHNAYIEIDNIYGETALSIAVYQGAVERGNFADFREIVEILMERGANPSRLDEGGNSLLCRVFDDNNYDISSEYVEYLLSPKFAQDVDMTNFKGESPLLLSLQYAKFPVFRLLLDRDADPYIQDDTGNDIFSLIIDREDPSDPTDIFTLARQYLEFKGITFPPFDEEEPDISFN